jgi:hypothetical protein
MRISVTKTKVVTFKGNISNLLQNDYFKLNYRTSFTLQTFKMKQIAMEMTKYFSFKDNVEP